MNWSDGLRGWHGEHPLLSAFLPLHPTRGRHDIERAELLVDSLNRFADPELLSVLRIAVTSDGSGIVRDRLVSRSRFPIEIVDEDELVPALASFRHLWNWPRQQALKLAGAASSPTPFVLVFDSDVICTRPTRLSNLVTGGKAIVQFEAMRVHPNWWRRSAAILDVRFDRDGSGMSVTPAILARAIASSLVGRIADLHGGDWARHLLGLYERRLPRGYLPWNWRNDHRTPRWTEYSLYYLHAVDTRSFQACHVAAGTREAPARLLSHHSHWNAGRPWRLSDAFGPDDTAHFVVAQSNSGIDPAYVRECVAPHLR